MQFCRKSTERRDRDLGPTPNSATYKLNAFINNVMNKRQATLNPQIFCNRPWGFYIFRYKSLRPGSLPLSPTPYCLMPDEVRVCNPDHFP